MAEGFEPYHVPQQSRRDKLRVLAQDAVAFHGGCAGFFPIYDPSLLGNPDFPAYGGGGHDSLLYNHHHHHQQHQQQELPLGGACKGSAVKEEGPNQMAGVNAPNIPPPASSHHPNYSDLLSSIPANPLPIQDMAANPFLYVPHSLRDYDHQSFNGSGSLLSLTPHDANIASTGQGLSLSLSSSSSHNATHPNLPPEIFNGAASNGMTARGSVSVSVVPLGPFTGYASILNGSRFLRPARQLLEEFCDVGREGLDAQRSAAAPDSPAESLGDMSGIDGDDGLGCGGELERKKPRLVSMLEEVYKKYKQYHQQLQLVVASFESVAGLGNAAPYANLALKAMSRHFRCLKNAITSQLQFPKKPLGHMNSHGKADGPGFGNPDGGLYGQRSVQNLGFFEHQPVWRTQRGLPERAVTVLRGWLFEHFLHPYPSDSDKLMLAKQTGLTRSQVSNWFINARVRLWKPMVEEIHMLETRQAKPAPQREEQQPQPHPPHGDASNDQSLPPPSPHALETRPATSSHRIMDAHYNVARNDLPEVMPVEPVSFSYNGLPDEAHHLGGGMGMACGGGGGGGGVSLTLGLHNGIGLSEPFPINVAQRFGLGLDPNGGGYVIGDGFEGQTRHFGGQLMHDFVG